MNVGFTGTQQGPRSRLQVYTVIELLSSLYESSATFHHGCCVGWDDKAARIAHTLGYELVGHPPRDKLKMSPVRNDRTYPPQDYLRRNRSIVTNSQVLIAAPRLNREEMRSGTWATIRYAVRTNKPGLVVWPNGDISSLVEAVNLDNPPVTRNKPMVNVLETLLSNFMHAIRLNYPMKGQPMPEQSKTPANHHHTLGRIEPNLAAKWIEDNAKDTDEQVTALIRRAFRFAFHAGAGAGIKLSEKRL